MSKKCEVCEKWLKNLRGYHIHFRRMHGNKQVQEVKVRIDYSQMKSILNRIQKLELDNSYLKSRVKNITSNNCKSVEEIIKLKQDTQRPERSGNEINMSGAIKEMKTIFKEGFNFRDFLTHVNVEAIEIPIMVEV